MIGGVLITLAEKLPLKISWSVTKCNDIGAISYVALSISLFLYEPQCITVPIFTDYNFVNYAE